MGLHVNADLFFYSLDIAAGAIGYLEYSAVLSIGALVYQNGLQTIHGDAHTAGCALISVVPHTAQVIGENDFSAAFDRNRPVPVCHNFKQLIQVR